jgi:hypothetical protein
LLSPMTVIRIVVRVVIRVWVSIGVWVIIGVVGVCVIIFNSWSVTAFRRHDSILRKSDPTIRPGVKKMILPSFNRFPFHRPMSDKVGSPPQRDHFSLCHVRFNIRNMTRVA